MLYEVITTVFNIRSGTYNERFSLDAIPGASAVNTVTFQSETGNRADVNITSSSNSSGANNYVVRFDGADYVTFKNLTITPTNASYGTALYIQGGSENNMFENVDFMGLQTTTTSNYMALVSYNFV